MNSSIILILITSALVISGCMIIFARNILSLITSLSIFSVFISLLYIIMDAPDVAMTEIALGAAVSTVILLTFSRKIVNKNLVGDSNIPMTHSNIVPTLILALFLIVTISIAGFELPKYGDGDTKIHQHLNKYYIDNTRAQIGTPSIVAAILASYRGYDTLGETTVILIAGIGVMLILSKKS